METQISKLLIHLSNQRHSRPSIPKRRQGLVILWILKGLLGIDASTSSSTNSFGTESQKCLKVETSRSMKSIARLTNETQLQSWKVHMTSTILWTGYGSLSKMSVAYQMHYKREIFSSSCWQLSSALRSPPFQKLRLVRARWFFPRPKSRSVFAFLLFETSARQCGVWVRLLPWERSYIKRFYLGQMWGGWAALWRFNSKS